MPDPKDVETTANKLLDLGGDDHTKMFYSGENNSRRLESVIAMLRHYGNEGEVIWKS